MIIGLPIVANVKDIGDIVELNGRFDTSYQTLEKNSYEAISSRDLAYSRIIESNKGSLKNGSIVREGSLFLPNTNAKRIWLRQSLAFNYPNEITQVHTGRRILYRMEYVLPDTFNANEYLESIGQENYHILKNTESIPTNRFGEDERTAWLFRDQAKNYGFFLKNSKIDELKIHMYTSDDGALDRTSAPFINQLYFSALCLEEGYCNISGESFSSDNGPLYNCRILGTRKSLDDLNHNTLSNNAPTKIDSNNVNANLTNPWDIEIPTIDNKLMEMKQ